MGTLQRLGQTHLDILDISLEEELEVTEDDEVAAAALAAADIRAVCSAGKGERK